MSRDPMQALTSVDTERAVIGALLIDPDAILRVSDWLADADFYLDRHKWIYAAIRGLNEQQTAIDYQTVCDRLAEDGHLAELGGAAYLTQLITSTPTAMHIADYGRTVYRLGTLRRLVQAAGAIARTAYQAGGDNLDAVIEKARRVIDSVAPDATDDAVLLWADSLEELIAQQLERVEEQADVREGMRVRVTFPWKAFERFKLRLRAGTVAVVAAGSGVGKTTFLECCAEHWAREGLQVAFFHLELAHQIMLDRRLVRLSGVPMDDVESGILTPPIYDAYEKMRQYPGGVHYVHCPGWSARRIANKARQLHAKGRCDVAIVDYLQKIGLDWKSGTNKADALGDVVEVFKVLSEQLGRPLMLASQVNRAAEYATRVTGSHIRGSGEPHEKANIVIVLDRPLLDQAVRDERGQVVAQPGQRSPEVTVRIDKNTLGPTGETGLIINASRFRILDRQLEASRAQAA